MNIQKTSQKESNFYSGKWPFLSIILTLFLLWISSAFFVSLYYKNGLPYYDSVGSYWNMFSIMNTTRDGGIIEGIKQASEYSLSWLQSSFAVLVEFFLPKAPHALILLNFICLGWAQISMYQFTRAMRFVKEKALTIAFLPLLPGALWSWYGGYIDMRRDPSFISLLTAAFFMFATYLVKPTVKGGIAVGILIGLTQWSRGNAAPYIVIILVSVLLGYLYSVPKREKVLILKSLLIPAISSLVLLLPYYAVNVHAILTKYLYGSWALGENRITSLGYVLTSIPQLVLGTSLIAVKFNAVFLVGSIVVFWYLWHKKLLTYSKRNVIPLFPLYAGIFTVFLTIVFNSFILGFNRFAGVIPNFPILVGLYAISCSFMVRVSIRIPKIHTLKVMSVFIGIIAIINAMRIAVSMPPTNPVLSAKVKTIAQEVLPILSGEAVAYFWLDHIHVHDLNFYITQQGGKPIRAGSVLAQGVDIEMPPDLNRSIEEQQNAFVRAAKDRRYIVVSDDLKSYEDKTSVFFIFQHGKPVIEGLLNDPSMKPIYKFMYTNRSFIVLENTGF